MKRKLSEKVNTYHTLCDYFTTDRLSLMVYLF